jgi:transcriptional antiterminator RfaH
MYVNAMLSWYAIRTRPRQEERALENLIYWGIETLAPRLEGNPARHHSHLFPGYIFARFEGFQMLHNIRFTRGVAYVVSFGGVPAPINDELIAEIQVRMDKTNVIRNENALSPGDKVMIQSGLLRDFVGVFERNVPSAERVQILLRSVAYSAHVEVSCLDVARVA